LANSSWKRRGVSSWKRRGAFLRLWKNKEKKSLWTNGRKEQGKRRKGLIFPCSNKKGVDMKKRMAKKE